MKLKAFSYVVLYHPQFEDDEEDTRIIKKEWLHLAVSYEACKIDALRCIPESAKSDRVEVIIRPF